MSTRGWSFPLARVLPARHRIATRIFSDVWSEVWLPEGRQRALARLGCYRDPVDGDWGRRSAAAHREFQKAAGLDVNGWWTTWVCWAVYGYGTERRHNPIRFARSGVLTGFSSSYDGKHAGKCSAKPWNRPAGA